MYNIVLRIEMCILYNTLAMVMHVGCCDTLLKLMITNNDAFYF